MVWQELNLVISRYMQNCCGAVKCEELLREGPDQHHHCRPQFHWRGTGNRIESEGERLMPDKQLDVQHLCVSFEARQGMVRAVRDVSFHVEKGEILGFVGESGSGKSVSVMSCLGLTARNGRAESGSIRFEARELSPAGLKTRAERKRRETMLQSIRAYEISMIFHPMTYMNPVLTIGIQVTEGIPARRKCSRQENRIRGIELPRMVGISSPEHRMGALVETGDADEVCDAPIHPYTRNIRIMPTLLPALILVASALPCAAAESRRGGEVQRVHSPRTPSRSIGVGERLHRMAALAAQDCFEFRINAEAIHRRIAAVEVARSATSDSDCLQSPSEAWGSRRLSQAEKRKAAGGSPKSAFPPDPLAPLRCWKEAA